MNYLKISLLFVSILSTECHCAELNFSSHRALINAAVSVAQAGSKSNFNRCIRNWSLISGVDDQTNKWLAEVPKTDRAIAFVEVGNVNYARHDFFIIDSDFAAYSQALAPVFLNSALRRSINRLQHFSANELRDAGSPEEDDGDCYFISLRSSSENHGIAIYGEPQKEATREVVKFLLKNKKLSSLQGNEKQKAVPSNPTRSNQ